MAPKIAIPLTKSWKALKSTNEVTCGSPKIRRGYTNNRHGVLICVRSISGKQSEAIKLSAHPSSGQFSGMDELSDMGLSFV